MPIAFAPLNFSVKNSLPCVPPHCPYGHGSENPGVKGYGSINPGVAQQTNLLPHQNFTLREIFHPCVPQHCCLQQHGSENPGVKGMILWTPGLRSTQGREFFKEKLDGAYRPITSRCDTPPPIPPLHLLIPVKCKFTVSRSKQNENHDD